MDVVKTVTAITTGIPRTMKVRTMMAEMTREDCMKVFEKHDRAAWRFHNANPKAFSENSVTYAKALLKADEKRKENK